MACRTESKTIGDHEYSVTQWPAERAMLMKLRVLKIVGPAMAALVGKDGVGQEADALEHGIHALFSNATPEEIMGLVKESVVGVARDGTKLTNTSFTEHFSGDSLLEVYQVFAFVMQVNYGNFLKGPLAERFLSKMGQE
jgi:hypothetical protein